MGRLAQRKSGAARRRRLRIVAWLGAAALFAAACASTPSGGKVHVVRPGENLYRISRHYGVSVDAIRRANRVRDVTELQVGQALRIPGARGDEPKAPLTPQAAGVTAWKPSRGNGAQALREADLSFAWPVRGSLTSSFGWRRGRRHEGIDIAARKGTPIHAAESGRIIFSGRLGDYGKVVIVKHAGRYSTVYAHNTRNKVKKGAFVEKGDVIATVGRTGNASGPHLHFEVRRDRVAHDPSDYLPKPGLARR